MIEFEKLVSAEKLADELGLKPATLACWRSVGRGPSYVKVGRKVFYDRADVAAWLAKQRRVATCRAA